MTIDRKALVDRHDVVLDTPDSQTPLTVGNGDFGYTLDITGMQTFRGFHDPEQAEPGQLVTNTCTQSSWGWHEMPTPEAYSLDDASNPYPTARGDVVYPDVFDMASVFGADPAPGTEAGNWLHVNPHRIDLGRVGLVLRADPSAEPERDPGVLDTVRQQLRLWTGTVHSSFDYAGEPVSVTTAAHPIRSEVAFRIESPHLASGRVGVGIEFPYASDGFMQTVDWEAADRHDTSVVDNGSTGARLVRTLDDTTYSVSLSWNSGTLRVTDDPHRFELTADGALLELVVCYTPGDEAAPVSSADGTLAEAADHWSAFWSTGAAVDFRRSTDPRSVELERRIVLSQYLTAVNCSGVTPPQETGLVTNSWQGKFHLEMHWWHAAHFVPWGRSELLARSLDWYRTILPAARATARRQGYEGARWPKQVGPEGRESPNEIGPFLVWQQPNPLYFAELLYRSDPSAEVVADMAELVEDSARFMASFVEERSGVFHLPAPLIPAQESYDRHTVEDPTFELAYWWWGLEIAQRWRDRLGLERNADWANIQTNLARPHQAAGVYTAIATEPYLARVDHPSLLAALGVVPPSPLVDADVMRATLDDVLGDWDWDSAWGWDFPVIAMTAARLGDPSRAVDALLMDRAKNQYLANGHNPQMGNFLPIYLPGNGGLLSAISLMVGGWDGADRDAPGFPDDGTWDLDHEGFTAWP